MQLQNILVKSPMAVDYHFDSGDVVKTLPSDDLCMIDANKQGILRNTEVLDFLNYSPFESELGVFGFSFKKSYMTTSIASVPSGNFT